jgi:ParB family transcriptional regulator, chromosome partitioning protein
LNRVINFGLSVRESEELTRKMNKTNQLRLDIQQKNKLTIHEQRLMDELRSMLGTRVSIIKENEVGKIEIEFYSEEDLERITECLLSNE